MNLLNKEKHKKSPMQLQREKWLAELKQIKSELEANEALFNMTDDFDLTDYTIHERTALEARYSYLIRLIRSLDETQTAVRLIEHDETNQTDITA